MYVCVCREGGKQHCDTVSYTHSHTHTLTLAHSHTCTFTHNTHTHTCTFTCTHVHTRTHTHTCTFTRTHTLAHAHTHTFTQLTRARYSILYCSVCQHKTSGNMRIHPSRNSCQSYYCCQSYHSISSKKLSAVRQGLCHDCKYFIIYVHMHTHNTYMHSHILTTRIHTHTYTTRVHIRTYTHTHLHVHIASFPGRSHCQYFITSNMVGEGLGDLVTCGAIRLTDRHAEGGAQ